MVCISVIPSCLVSPESFEIFNGLLSKANELKWPGQGLEHILWSQGLEMLVALHL